MKNENLQAIILAGGKGTRIKRINSALPKVLFPLAKKPLLDYLIDHLKKNGFNDIIICTGYLADKVKDYVSKTDYGIKIRTSREDTPLGAAGALHLIKDLLNDEFFVLYGDIYTTINLEKMLKFHKSKKADVTIALHISDHPRDSTIVKIDKSKKIVNFIEKPGDDWKQYGNLTATSLYIMKKSVLKFIAKNKTIDFAKDVFPKMLKNRGKLFGYITSEYAKDIGTPERYKKVEQYITLNKR
ncbi:MAG: nucleotidyltransferase family protein [Candidatus Levybacteria bacterium]|nr:nucleotidyltransferase family protein [Candidatus Levybacteria bacterium]